MAVMIFAGTTEGRLLAEHAEKLGLECFVSTATEYGAELLEDLRGINVICGRMDEDQISSFLKENKVQLVIDATHPFARAVSQNIRNACEREHVQLVRCLREEETPGWQGKGKVVSVSSVQEAARYLAGTKGNILIATGSKELNCYTSIPEYKERCYARVLSTKTSVEESIVLGFEGRHLIAMQGPFSLEMNIALLRQTQAQYFVTKESGKEGGFAEKAEAAYRAGAVLVVITRPQEQGMSVGQVMEMLESIR